MKKHDFRVSASFLMVIGLVLFLSPTTRAEASPLTSQETVGESGVVTVVEFPPNAKTTVELVGTELTPRSRGRAEFECTTGQTRIKVKLDGMRNPQNLGVWYTSFVVWAISPDGRPLNLGPLVFKNGEKAELETAAAIRKLGLIVTAEPHSLVTVPSRNTVVEVAKRGDSVSRLAQSQVEYRCESEENSQAGLTADFFTPLPVVGARNAVLRARLAGARQSAVNEFQRAERQLTLLEQTWIQRPDKLKTFADIAQDTIRFAEVARTTSLARQNTPGPKTDATADVREEGSLVAARTGLHASLSELFEIHRFEGGLILTLNDFPPETTRQTLKPETRMKLVRLAQCLKSFIGDYQLDIEDRADSTAGGNSRGDQFLSRAEIIRAILIQSGISPDRFRTVSGPRMTSPAALPARGFAGANQKIEIILFDSDRQR